MSEKELAEVLSAAVAKHSKWGDGTWDKWDEDFEGLTVFRERHFVELEYADSGVGEDMVAQALAKEWPQLDFEVSCEGGCDSCGFGRRVTFRVSGPLDGTPFR